MNVDIVMLSKYLKKRGALESESSRKQNKQWSVQTIEVGLSPFEYVTFAGKKLYTEREVEGERQNQVFDYVLYQTPYEGYKLYVEEDITEGGLPIQPGARFPIRHEVRKTLYSEEEAKKEYPEIFVELLERFKTL